MYEQIGFNGRNLKRGGPLYDAAGAARSNHSDNFAAAQVAPGELLVIVGTVGAGKSSLLSGLLGEMLLTKVCLYKARARVGVNHYISHTLATIC